MVIDLSKEQDVRIGFYVCHCGSNIAAMIDVEAVQKYVDTLPNVTISRHYKYMCSDPGQELIQQDIREHKLNRIVVAACSPLLHELTFRNATEKAGLNPYYFQMVNIREHNAWVHTDGRRATRKAMSQVRAAIERVALHEPLEMKKVPINPAVLIVGGGIAGISAALAMANAGKQVYFVEREATIGGHMAKFDKTFPTLDCAACVLSPKMSAVKEHPNITLWTLSEVDQVDGYVGNYQVRVKRHPRYIVEDLCTGCLECVEACVYLKPKFDDEFNLGLSKRRPVYMPFPQATPPVVTIDPEACLQVKTGRCKQTCVEACGDRNAIDLNMEESFEEIEVGTVIVSTGFQTFSPVNLQSYGYRRYPNVFTGLEVERLVNTSGPTAGEILTKDGRKPKKIAIIHCIGSRDENTNVWCSRVCCLYSLKLAHLMHERTNAEITNFYIDMRTPGKAMEEFYNRVAAEGVQMIRGKIADIYPDPEDPESGQLVVQGENTLLSRVHKTKVDMVILAHGLEPQPDAQDVRRTFNMSCSKEGWFLERHVKLAPVSTFTDGVFIAGCCSGPKDIPDSVAQAGAAAAEAMALIDKGYIEQAPDTAWINADACSGCKTCIPLCPYTAITRDEEKGVAVINEALCKGCGTCVAACPSGAAQQHLFTDDEIYKELEGILCPV